MESSTASPDIATPDHGRSPDPTRARAFAQRMLGALNAGALALMTSLGHRTRLFDTLAAMPPSTDTEIAEAAGLAPRYVREWLAAMVSASVVEHDAVAGTYALPPEHAAFLTRAARPRNIAVSAQFLPLIAAMEERILECFEHGGGLPYHAYHRFHDVMAEASDQSVVARLLDQIVPLAPGLGARLESGVDALDVGCGQGRAPIALARAFPRSRFVGIDLCEDAIATARADARRQGVANVRFERADMAAFDQRERFDLVTTFDAIHDQADPPGVLCAIVRALRPDGVYLMQELQGSSHVEKNLEHPLATFLYAISTVHCTPVSRAQGGVGLGTLWGEESTRQALAEAGFRSVQRHVLPDDVLSAFYVARQ